MKSEYKNTTSHFYTKVSLGKEHAGHRVLVEMPEPGVWFIRPVSVISNNEKWMHTPALKKDLSTALDWEKNSSSCH